MTLRAVLFDLDDTLYREMDFVDSGFSAVAEWLSPVAGLSAGALVELMRGILADSGRGRVFDMLLEQLGLGHVTVETLLFIYRSHAPEITLYDGISALLDELRAMGLSLGLVTDGMASVQRRKMNALGTDRWFSTSICTDEIGREHWKPSAVPFRTACAMLGVKPEDSMYIGDNPAKDFLGARKAGLATMQAKYIVASDETLMGDAYRADCVANRLPEVLELIMKR